MHYLRHLARLYTSDIHPGGAHASRELLEALAPADGQRLLELGCGTAKTALRLTRRVHAYVVGVDLLSEMLLPARRRLRPASDRSALVQARVSELPFVEQSFDRVYAESTLGIQNDPDLRASLAETFRVLKPGGRFVANEAVWKSHVSQATVNAVNQRTECDFGLRQASERAWSVDRWLEEIRRVGFEPLTWSLIEARPHGMRTELSAGRWLRRLRILASRETGRRHAAYRRRLAEHRGDAALVEARLFVCAKPMRA
jgi:SAM-dependent methyltransferase